MFDVIFEIRVGVLPAISKYIETSLKTGRSRVSRYLEIGGRTLNECLKLLLKQTSILGKNPAESWQNSAVSFHRFPNTD